MKITIRLTKKFQVFEVESEVNFAIETAEEVSTRLRAFAEQELNTIINNLENDKVTTVAKPAVKTFTKPERTIDPTYQGFRPNKVVGNFSKKQIDLANKLKFTVTEDMTKEEFDQEARSRMPRRSNAFTMQ